MVGAQKTETFPGLGVEYWFGKEMYELVDFFSNVSFGYDQVVRVSAVLENDFGVVRMKKIFPGINWSNPLFIGQNDGD